MTNINRRRFFQRSAQFGMTMLAAAALRRGHLSANEPGRTKPTFVAFTESFQGWPIPDVCARFKQIGLDGLDLTVRPGGHIEPADAPQKLPDAVRAAKDHGVRIAMLSTAITGDDPQAERLLATAGEQGIDRVKLGYYRYDKFGTLTARIDEVRGQLARVARLGRKHGVLPCVHIHSGDTIPSGGALAYLLLKGLDPAEIGAYVDPMHMTIEGGNDGWRQGLDLLAPWIAISSLKNARRVATQRDAQGQQRWKFEKCPLADGIAPIPDYLARLNELGYHGLYTLHSEYCDSNSWKTLTAEECLEQTRVDLEFVRGVMGPAP